MTPSSVYFDLTLFANYLLSKSTTHQHFDIDIPCSYNHQGLSDAKAAHFDHYLKLIHLRVLVLPPVLSNCPNGNLQEGKHPKYGGRVQIAVIMQCYSKIPHLKMNLQIQTAARARTVPASPAFLAGASASKRS